LFTPTATAVAVVDVDDAVAVTFVVVEAAAADCVVAASAPLTTGDVFGDDREAGLDVDPELADWGGGVLLSEVDCCC
jgi:hypothetical protein